MATACGDDEASSGPPVTPDGGVVGVDASEDAPPGPVQIGLTVGPSARVVPGASVDVPVTVTRTNFDGDVLVEVSGLQAEVSAATLTVAAGSTTGVLKLSASATATLASRKLASVRATAGGATIDAPLDVIVVGAPGTLDTTFDFDGKLTADLAAGANDVIMTMVLQANGSIVAAANNITAGTITTVRYDASGQPDPTFGGPVGAGRVVTTSSFQQRADGSLVLAYIRNSPSTQAVFAGFDKDGKPIAFGTGTSLALGSAELGGTPDRVALGRAANGDLYAAVANGPTTKIFRFTQTGTVDTTFGTAGYVTVTSLEMVDFTVDAAGNFLVAGGANMDRSVVRVTPAGQLDNTFSGDGRLTLADSSNEQFYSPIVLPGGRIALAASGAETDSISMLLTSGDPDNAFDGDGLRPTTLFPLRLGVYGNDVLGVGGTGTPFSYGFRVVRVSSTNGQPNASFGTDGVVTADFGVMRCAGNAFVVDELGRITIGGYREDTDLDATLVRLWL